MILQNTVKNPPQNPRIHSFTVREETLLSQGLEREKTSCPVPRLLARGHKIFSKMWDSSKRGMGTSKYVFGELYLSENQEKLYGMYHFRKPTTERENC